MADENETAPMPENEDVEDHGHCSDCENDEHHFDDGDKGEDSGTKKKKKKPKKKKKSAATEGAQDPLAKVVKERLLDLLSREEEEESHAEEVSSCDPVANHSESISHTVAVPLQSTLGTLEEIAC